MTALARLAKPAPSDNDKEPATRVARLTHELAEARPDYSARCTVTIPQLLRLYLSLSLVLAGLAYFPVPTASLIVGFLTLFYLASFVFKTVLFCLSPAPQTAPLAERADTTLPIYTILVPLYREADALPALLSGLLKLDYPREKLDIKFILEADDHETAVALARLALPPMIEIIAVPACRPRTKPKALVYGLSFARGAYVVVYDAEDQPEPDQLRRALARFEQEGPETACLQARLNFYNARENWLCAGIMAQTPQDIFPPRS